MIHDDDKIRQADLPLNPLFKENDAGKNRNEIAYVNLQKLNPSVDLSVHKGEISLEMLTHFDLVIFADFYQDIEKLYEINKFCRAQKKPIGFILAGVLGLFGFVFSDFGDAFKIYD